MRLGNPHLEKYYQHLYSGFRRLLGLFKMNLFSMNVTEYIYFFETEKSSALILVKCSNSLVSWSITIISQNLGRHYQ